MKKKGRLDEEQLYQLLRDADDLWYREHTNTSTYREQLEFTAEFISKNYKVMEGILLASSSILLGKEEKDEQE